MINGDRLVEMVECYLLYLLRGEGPIIIKQHFLMCSCNKILCNIIIIYENPDKNFKMVNVAVAAGGDGKLQMHLLNTSTFRYF